MCAGLHLRTNITSAERMGEQKGGEREKHTRKSVRKREWQEVETRKKCKGEKSGKIPPLPPIKKKEKEKKRERR